jgi:hypothetical protein
MEKRSGSDLKALTRHIEDLELKIKTLEQTLTNLHKEVGGIREAVLDLAGKEAAPESPIPEQLDSVSTEESIADPTPVPPEDFEAIIKQLDELDETDDGVEQPPPLSSRPDTETDAASLPKDKIAEEAPEKADSQIPSDVFAEKKSASVGQFSQRMAAIKSKLHGDRPGADKDRGEKGLDIETRIGTYWFNRIGLVALIIGFALLARMITPKLEPWHKVVGSYFISGLLFFCGWHYEKKLKQFARPVMAGALSLVFLISFAAHFLEPMACVPLWVSLILMSLSVGLVFFWAERWGSEPTAGFAIFLGNVAAFIAAGNADAFSLIAILFLSLTAFGLFLRHDWLPLSLFSVIAAYFTHLLWAWQAHPPSTPSFQFWVNFQFLTSYYIIFLVADLIYRRRVYQRGIEAFSPKQRLAGRGVGPATLILYATIAAGLFHTTKIYWENIYLFCLPLAGLQVFLFEYHRRKANPDYPIYAAAGALFAVLGLFSLMNGLVLNMALAAEALLLLVLARQMNFGFLSLLAQLVLIVNFIHFFSSSTMQIETWPVFFGNVMTAIVYFVKSRLEETWPIDPKAEEKTVSRWAIMLQAAFEKHAKSLAFVHAIAGAFLLLYICQAFFDAPWDSAALAGFTLIAVMSAYILKSRTMVPAVWALQVAWVLLIFRHLNMGHHYLQFWAVKSQTGMDVIWLTDQLVCLLMAGSAVALLEIARRKDFIMGTVMGVGFLIISIPAYFLAAKVGVPLSWTSLIWTFGPLIFWLEAETVGRYLYNQNIAARSGFPDQTYQWFAQRLGVLKAALSVTAATLTIWTISAVIPAAMTAVLIISLAALLLFTYTIYRNSNSLLPGLNVFLFLSILFFIQKYQPLPVSTERLLAWWFVFVMVGGACVQIVFATIRKQASFYWSGLVAMATAMLAFAHLLISLEFSFQPFALWLLTVSGFWFATELVRLKFAAIEDGQEEWKDRLGLKFLMNSSTHLMVLYSVAATVLLTLITARYFEYKLMDHAALCGAVTAYAALFFLLGIIRRSPSLAAAYLVFLSIAHGIFQFKLGHTGMGAPDHAILAFLLIGLSLLAGTATEKYLKNNKDILTQSQNKWVEMGTWYPYILTFLLGALFFKHQSQVSQLSQIWKFLATPMRFPVQAILVAIGIVLGRNFRLPRIQLASYGYLIFIVLSMLIWAIQLSRYRGNLLFAGILVLGYIILVERILSRQPHDILQHFGKKLPPLLVGALQIAAGFFMLVILQLSDLLRGYWTTVGWSFVALLLMTLGFWWQERVYRRTALIIFALSILRIAIFDITGLEPFYRVAAFITLGACLIFASFLYSRFHKEINRWL